MSSFTVYLTLPSCKEDSLIKSLILRDTYWKSAYSPDATMTVCSFIFSNRETSGYSMIILLCTE